MAWQPGRGGPADRWGEWRQEEGQLEHGTQARFALLTHPMPTGLHTQSWDAGRAAKSGLGGDLGLEPSQAGLLGVHSLPRHGLCPWEVLTISPQGLPSPLVLPADLGPSHSGHSNTAGSLSPLLGLWCLAGPGQEELGVQDPLPGSEPPRSWTKPLGNTQWTWLGEAALRGLPAQRSQHPWAGSPTPQALMPPSKR